MRIAQIPMDKHPGWMRDIAMGRQREEGLHRVMWAIASLYVVIKEEALATPLYPDEALLTTVVGSL